MRINVEHILRGWANYVKDTFNILPDDLKEMSAKRLQHCDICEIRTNKSCDPWKEGKHVVTGEIVRGCGCNIAAKSMVPEAECPMGKWEEYIVED